MDRLLLAAIEQTITKSQIGSCKIERVQPVGGGCINLAFSVLLSTGQKLFVKVNEDVHEDFFVCESGGLDKLRSALPLETIRIPTVIGLDSCLSASGRLQRFLILEWVESGTAASDFFEKLGRGLASLHQYSNQEQFGFPTDNYLGKTKQQNQFDSDWVRFWGEQRLGFQLGLVKQNRIDSSELVSELLRKGSRLIERLDKLIGRFPHSPSLIHGDLWSGNFMCDASGCPVLIDPAPYFASFEAEFGMTTLFGGFDDSFYEAYKEVNPLADGFEIRVEIYRLYHLLNHLNLFGKSYLRDCLNIVRKYVGK